MFGILFWYLLLEFDDENPKAYIFKNQSHEFI